MVRNTLRGGYHSLSSYASGQIVGDLQNHGRPWKVA